MLSRVDRLAAGAHIVCTIAAAVLTVFTAHTHATIAITAFTPQA